MIFTLNINHIISLSPSLEAFFIAKIDDLKAKLATLNTALDEEKAQADAKDAVIADLRVKLEGTLSAEDAIVIEAELDALLAKAPDTVKPEVAPEA